jgi:3-hydroxyacyl-[acyl-carrier-protein] dehydratase
MTDHPAPDGVIEDVDIGGVMRMLPHRYPFLMIDRVVALEPERSAVGIKNVTINEPFFPGHFPTHPVMPGVLVIEAMAQTAALLAFETAQARLAEREIIYFAGIDDARFKRPVVPGDQLIMRAELERQLRGVWKFSAVAHVGEQLAAEARLMCTMRSA